LGDHDTVYSSGGNAAGTGRRGGRQVGLKAGFQMTMQQLNIENLYKFKEVKNYAALGDHDTVHSSGDCAVGAGRRGGRQVGLNYPKNILF
jgi:hypothetical protein